MESLKAHISLFVLPLLLFSLPPTALSQSEGGNDSLRYMEAVVTEDDTLPLLKLGEIRVSDSKDEKGRSYQRKYKRLKEKVVKVYPYAEVAALLLKYYESRLQEMNMEVQQKAYLKKVERELKKEFKSEITDMTISEGRVLMKLIDRETGNTSYEIIEELRGNVPAFFWQSVARVFGSDLKTAYDPVDEDRIVEDIILDIKSGELEIPEREPQSEKVRRLLKDHEGRGRWWDLKG